MLSYQHIYHAGNLADVHKHALLCAMLDYLTRKDKPLSYIETHAGRGLYDLAAPEAVRNGEAAAGIGALEGRLPADHPYRRRLVEVRARFGATAYPGSPLLAALSLRKGDVMHLAELHPQEYQALSQVMAPFGAHLRPEDGFRAARALVPPTPRRGLMLIDPSFEVKADYAAIPGHLAAIHRKWAVGTLALWYPILPAAPHAPMIAALCESFPDALDHQVRFPPARPGHGLIGSGMFIANPPWGAQDEAARLTALFASLKG
ncbi:23S rRNA (adenine(2030)-N(6))-methyltransferase RlmJ [Rhodovulum tesquicola]|uniref:23S rRNA (adenine(2030)-N(6))-methyltransferase RlmJ n=1 Tax=Rhodovulum tesquicola TaxID=540254 RepID=UPI0020985160|nr:23S rRNA (adenine(2030)-N(6))-methyltransferase RlmJ [Rhodovulum tesquicola]MCO8145677.1 23S rRNA (adenine(2030)-N(6))-methyltransferase RlmJ [Rhodovulum tesquicola]